MATKKITIPEEAPFTLKGDLLTQVPRWGSKDVIMVKNDPFGLDLRLGGIGATYSGTSLVMWKAIDGRRFYMYDSEFDRFCNTLDLTGGWTGDRMWQVRKHSTSYGLMLIDQ